MYYAALFIVIVQTVSLIVCLLFYCLFFIVCVANQFQDFSIWRNRKKNHPSWNPVFHLMYVWRDFNEALDQANTEYICGKAKQCSLWSDWLWNWKEKSFSSFILFKPISASFFYSFQTYLCQFLCVLNVLCEAHCVVFMHEMYYIKVWLASPYLTLSKPYNQKYFLSVWRARLLHRCNRDHGEEGEYQ